LSGQVGRWSLYYVYLAIAEFVLIYMATVGFYIAGERISRMFRTTYLRSIIQQEMAFFDEFGVGELTERITTDINRIQEALSSKLAVAFTAAATFSVSLAIALSSYWSLAFIVVAGIAVIGVAEALGGRFAIRFQGQALRYYSNGSATVQEAIGSIRHVYAFGLQDAMAQRYENQLHQAEAAGLKARFAVALMISVMNSAPYFIYGTAFWQGVRFVVAGELTATKVVQIAMATVTGAFSVGRVAPALESFVASIASARPLIETIAARPHSCDPFSTDGDTISGIQGALSLQNMSLVYPSRPNVTVLKNINCDFPVYCTTAVVGESGCGKSSIVSLIERFYTPSEGQICE
jgi:ATP-binding cassette subfamily B (MDR/TAP) protein 1